MAAKPPFTRFAEALTERETALRTDAANIANMGSSLQSIAQRTGGGTINPSEIPAVAGLANRYATVQTGSQQRETTGVENIKRLPKYVDAYKSYLRWRYPTRYGSKGSSGNPYVPGMASSGGYVVPSLGAPGSIPRFGEE